MAAWMTSETDVKPAYDGTWDDVSGKADYWLTKVVARARTIAPCLKDAESLPSEVQESAKGIIVNAVLRLLDPNGNTQTETMGPFSHSIDTKNRSDRLLSIPDRDELQQLCRGAQAPQRTRSIPLTLGYRR